MAAIATEKKNLWLWKWYFHFALSWSFGVHFTHIVGGTTEKSGSLQRRVFGLLESGNLKECQWTKAAECGSGCGIVLKEVCGEVGGRAGTSYVIRGPHETTSRERE